MRQERGCGIPSDAGGCWKEPARQLQLPVLHASADRITRITVCTRPFRALGPRLDVESIGNKTIVHKYGHGGSGWSLSWGSSGIAVRNAMARGDREIAVIGCGALGLTSALLLQRAGARPRGAHHSANRHSLWAFFTGSPRSSHAAMGWFHYYGYGDEATAPDRGEAQRAVDTIAGLFS